MAPSSTPPAVNAQGRAACPKCTNALLVEGPAAAGRHPGLFYLHCHACSFHFAFGDESVLPPVVLARRSTSPRLAVDSFPQSSLSATTNTATPLTQLCTRSGCRKAGNANCGSGRRCKKCCVEVGGCALRGHAVALQTSTKATPSTLTPTLSTNTSVFTPPSWLASPGVHTWGSFIDGVQAAASAMPRSEDEEQIQPNTAIARSSQPATSAIDDINNDDGPHLMPSSTPITKVTTTRKPTITRHMNAVWSRDSQGGSSAARSAPHKKASNPNVTNRFRLVWYPESGTARFVLIEDPPSVHSGNGTWSILEAPTDLCEELRSFPVDFYDVSKGFWIGCSPSTQHTVTTDSYVILRRRDAVCSDLASVLAQITKKVPQYKCYADAAGIKKAKATHAQAQSDSDIEIVSTPTQRNRKGKGKRVHCTPTPRKVSTSSEGSVEIVEGYVPRKKTRAYSPLPISSSESETDWLLFPPSPYGASSSSIASATSVDSCSAPSQPLSPATLARSTPIPGPPPHVPGSRKQWPFTMYVVDIVHGFSIMETLKMTQPTLEFEERFQLAFPGEHIPAARTYSDHILKWNHGDPAVRQRFIDAKQTSMGHWAEYSKLYPLKK